MPEAFFFGGSNRTNTCTDEPSFGVRFGQTCDPLRVVSTMGSINASASMSGCRLRMEPLSSAVSFPFRERAPVHFHSVDFRSNECSVTLSSSSDAASSGYSVSYTHLTLPTKRIV